MKHKFTDKLMNNLGLKIMALFFAVLLWLLVVNNDDPVDTQRYSNIPVVVENEDVVFGSGKVYQILNETETVTVTIRAKRSVLTKIKADDIVATADFQDMELVSLVPISVSIKGHEGEYESATATPHNLQVKVEDSEQNWFPLTVSTTGTLRDGYVLGTLKTNPERIKIGGAESLVKSIDKAVAKINISGMGESDTVTATLFLYDAEGNVVDQTLLTNNLGKKGLTVDVQVLGTKDIPIKASTFGTPAEGYSYNGMAIDPETVKVYGTQEALEDVEELVIPSSVLDISGLTEKKDFMVDISSYLEENISLVDESVANVVVTVTIEPLDTKTIELPKESISINNLASGFKLEYATIDEIQLQFSGTEELLEKLDIKSAVFIDVSNITKAGEYDVPVTVECPTGITLVNSPTVKVKVSDKE